MDLRQPVVAGQFYPASPSQCRRQIQEMIDARATPDHLPSLILAGVVPHAGWVFSGDLAALVFNAIKKRQTVDTFILFGAIHTVRTSRALLFAHGVWQSPLGPIAVDENLCEHILLNCKDLFENRPEAHIREHSLEVQIPIIQTLFPQARIVPILVPPTDQAHEVGEALASLITSIDKKIVAIASSDLTHYGPNYGYTPMGIGPSGNSWAKETNDKYFIDLALAMQAETLVESEIMYHNACGAGAVAAAVALANKLGAERGQLLAQTCSAEIMREKFGRSDANSVGYAAMIFGKSAI